MRSIVIYATRTGNTGRVAEAVSAALAAHGESQLLEAEAVTSPLPAADLVVIGSPTEGHGIHPTIEALFERLGPEAFRERSVAAFDTRVRWPRWLSGSAASKIRDRASRAGGRCIGTEHSAVVSMKPELEAGEVQRATTWAHTLAEAIEPAQLVSVG